MSTWWCESAWLGGESVASSVVIEVDGESILNLTTDVVDPPPGATRLVGLTLPALANTHSHAFHRALRGRTHGDRGTFWTWRDLMYEFAGRLDPDNYYDLASSVYAEMTLAGIGVVGEFHYVHHQRDGSPYAEPNAMSEALLAAARDVGVRITLLDTLYLQGGFDDDGPGVHAPLRPEQRRFSDTSVERWSERVGAHPSDRFGARARLGAAIHSVRAANPEAIATASSWATSQNAPLHFHVSEQPIENEQCVAAYGCTPIELLEAGGALGERSTAVHATHLSANDLGLLASSGSATCLCPTTERDLADGIGPSRQLARHGVPISVGSDSHAVIDILEEARAVELDERLVSLERGVHSAPELLDMATHNGYSALGWSLGGRLKVGNLADFATVGFDSVRLAGLDAEHALASVAFSATAADVHSVVVGGRQIVSGGEHARLDVPAALRSSIAAVAA